MRKERAFEVAVAGFTADRVMGGVDGRVSDQCALRAQPIHHRHALLYVQVALVIRRAETVGTFDDPGVFSGNAIVVLQDGSVSNQTFEGTTDATTDPNRLSGTGTWKMESGTGRFAGLTASGPFRWSMVGDEYEDEF